MKPKILIVYTGGTIGMIEDPVSKALRPFNFDHLIENVPKVKMLDYEIDHIQFDQPIDSSDMNVKHWDHICHAIADNYDAYDGFVVLHGTDTMAYTASALSFMLEDLHKPVIITGSQLPIGEVRTDGEENLITALQIAADRDINGKPTVQEVAILFEDYLWRGNRSTKRSADNFNAFKSNNYPELARIGLGIHFNHDVLHKVSDEQPLKPHYNLDTNVMPVDLFPGLSPEILRHQLFTPGVKGIVLRTYGAGNAPTAPWFIEAVRECIESGRVILNVTQCVNGGVHPKRYVAGNLLAETGVVSGEDLTFEAAITKMMFLFGQGYDAKEVSQRLTRSIAGEMTLSRPKA
ncbi:MAG: asparaginase [Muribaculaceae bacterium]|nr:asparaginase [Muribaculaceae bacterium]